MFFKIKRSHFKETDRKTDRHTYREGRQTIGPKYVLDTVVSIISALKKQKQEDHCKF